MRISTQRVVSSTFACFQQADYRYSNLRLCSDSLKWPLFFISPRMRWSRSSGSAVYDLIRLSVFFYLFIFLLIMQTENILWSGIVPFDRAGEISSYIKQHYCSCKGPNSGQNTWDLCHSQLITHCMTVKHNCWLYTVFCCCCWPRLSSLKHSQIIRESQKLDQGMENDC